MTTGYVLILAVLILGGVIATLGDRIGMRVGKARLSLFRLRPRQTATVVSIVTGSIISATTLGLLFAVSRQLRTGVFELEQIQSDLTTARAELEETRSAKAQIEQALTSAQQRQQAAQAELQQINESLQQAVRRQRATQAELQQTQAQLGQLREQLQQVSTRSQQLQTEIQRLEQERATLLEQQATVQTQLQERDRQIAVRDRQIAQREQRLSQLQARQALLQEDIAALERRYEGLFRGNVAVGRNDRLAVGLIRVNTVTEARAALDQLLREANQRAIQAIAPGTNLERQVLRLRQEDILRQIRRISDGQTYVVQVLSDANYVIGESCVVNPQEPCIRVFFDTSVNELVYERHERLATVEVTPEMLTEQGLVERLNLLYAYLQFRARQDGVVDETPEVAEGRDEAILAFLSEIEDYPRPFEIVAIAAEPIYVISPLQVELVAVSDGQVIARTDEQPLPRVPESEN